MRPVAGGSETMPGIVRPILRHPDARLRTRCAPVGSRDVRGFAADLLATMYAAPGRGLAAPQVGVALRLFVTDVGWRAGVPCPEVFVDPEVLEVSGPAEEAVEGCLSIPGRPTWVPRPARARLRRRDAGGAVREGWLEGAAARCALHEIDHLDGVLILDHGRPVGAAPGGAGVPAVDAAADAAAGGA